MRASSQAMRAGATVVVLAAILVAIPLHGCGEGKPQTYVSGVAATGGPIGDARVTLKDGLGKARSARTAADGSFRVASTGLSPPYLLQVAAPGGSLYSVSADDLESTTINVTTLTDLMARAWFKVNGVNSLDAVFDNPAGIAYPTPTQVEDIEGFIDGVFALWLRDAGVDPAAHNQVTTPFKADGTGIDRVLEQTIVSGWTITITGPAVATARYAKPPRAAAEPGDRTQETTLTFDPLGKTVTADTLVGAGQEVTTSLTTKVVATTSAAETAFQQIDACIAEAADVANQKGQLLTAADVLPFIDPEHLGQGLDQQEAADLFVAQTKPEMANGATFGGYLISLDQLDTVNGTAHGYYTFTTTLDGQTATNRQESRFRLVDGKWLLSGDGRPGYMYVKEGTFTDAGGWSMNLEALAEMREGAYVSASITGGPWVDLGMAMDGGTWVDEAGHEFRAFLHRTTIDDVATLPPAGTAFTFTMQPTGGPAEQYVVAMNASTSAQVSIVNAPVGSVAELVGTSVTLTWTLPTTVDIDEVNLQGQVEAGPPGSRVSCDLWGEPLGTTATSGSIDIPETCDGQPVTDFYLEVNVEGVNGEEMSGMRMYQ